MKTLYWLIKREFWEHRGGFFWAPAITAAVFLMIAIMSIMGGEVMGRHMGVFPLDGHVDIKPGETLSAEQFQQVGAALDAFICGSAIVLVVIMAIVVFFYCLGSLYDDRKDRSILFWESLPISNWKTILSKVLSATLVAPVIAVAIGVALGLLLLAMGLVILMFHGFNAWYLLSAAHPIHIVFDIIALIPLYALCALPTIGWLMLCSAWSRSMPFLWALVIPLGSNLVVWWLDVMGLLNINANWYLQHVTARLLFGLRPLNWLEFSHGVKLDQATAADQLGLIDNYGALTSPGLWIGVVAGIVMLGTAIWLRRWRTET
jgi:ABC-2 type transport system permease protein